MPIKEAGRPSNDIVGTARYRSKLTLGTDIGLSI